MGDISPCSFTFGWAFHRPPKPPFSWFVRVTAQVQAIACASCQSLHDLKRVAFLKINFLIILLAFLVPSTVTVPFNTIYTSLQSHKSDHSIGVINLTFLLKDNIDHLINHLLQSAFLSQTLIQLNHLITCYNTCLNSFNISSLFSGGITIS